MSDPDNLHGLQGWCDLLPCKSVLILAKRMYWRLYRVDSGLLVHLNRVPGPSQVSRSVTSILWVSL